MVTRRTALFGFSALAPQDIATQLAALEAKAGGRLGVCVRAPNGRMAGHRLDERFAMCSTFKLPLAALILREADRGRLKLDEFVPYTKADIVAASPVTSEHLAEGGMKIHALARATQTTSDNTAANLLLPRLGGPAGFTAALRSLGDQVTRLDRIEPAMNLVPAGDPRDTTTPGAMAQTLAKLLDGKTLTRSSHELLVEWMVATTTGTKRIRAGLPAGWRAGDKTGTATGMPNGMTNKYNDVAAVWPIAPGRPMAIITAYFDTSSTAAEMRDEDQAVLADAGRLAAQWITSA